MNDDYNKQDMDDMVYSPNMNSFKKDVNTFWYTATQAMFRLPLVPHFATIFNGVDGKRLVDLKLHQAIRILEMMSISGSSELDAIMKNGDIDIFAHRDLLVRFRTVQIRTLTSYVTRAMVSLRLPVEVLLHILSFCIDDPLFKTVDTTCIGAIQYVYGVYNIRH